MKQNLASDQTSTAPKTKKFRTNPHVQMRVLDKYAAGKKLQDIVREEHISRSTVNRIVRTKELDAYIEEKRESWRGLCDIAIEVLREKLVKEKDKGLAMRVLESNNVVMPAAMTINQNIVKETKTTEDDRVANLRAKFADVMMERAKVFKTPFPELAEIAEKSDIKLDFDLNPPQDETEDDEENE